MNRRYLQVNDPHVSDQAPLMRTASYTDDVIAKLKAAIDLAVVHECDAVVITGDLFHRKNAAHTSHLTVQRVREALEADIPVRIVRGNHDCRRGTDSIAGQPVLSVVGGNVAILTGYGDDYVYGVPWVDEMEGPDGIRSIAQAIPPGVPLIFAHAPVTLTPYPFGPEQAGWIMAEELAEALPDSARLFAHGHMHKGHPLAKERDIVFSNPGALSRATIGTDDVDREPQVALITYDTEEQRVQVAYLSVPHRPAEEVFRLAVAEAATGRAVGIATLVEAIATASQEEVTAESLIGILRALPRPDDIDPDIWSRGITMGIEALEDANA